MTIDLGLDLAYRDLSQFAIREPHGHRTQPFHTKIFEQVSGRGTEKRTRIDECINRHGRRL